MAAKVSAPELAFDKALRSFQTGSVSYSGLMDRVSALLAAGAAPAALRAILRRRESVVPLPEDAHDAVMGLLESALPIEAATIVLDERDGGDRMPPAEGTTPRQSVSVGDVLLDRFHLVELVGESGMSRVFKAIDSRPAPDYASESFVAVKLLTRPFNEHSGQYSALQAEVNKLRALEHPNIVRMFGCERYDSTVFMTMEYLIGDSLFAKLCSGAPASFPAQSIIAGIAGALEYAHGHDVVHGDLKPGNVIITREGEVKVIDFGIASLITRPQTAHERRESAQSNAGVLGHVAAAITPRYASPQLMARQQPDVSDDVYALACLSYELLTGNHPFDGGSGAQTLRFPPPLRAGLTPPQYTALVHGLQRERLHRTATIQGFMEEFQAPARRSRWTTPAIWASAALVVLGGAAWILGRRPPPVAPPSPMAQVARPTPSPALPAAVARPGTVLRDCPTCPLLTVVPTGRFEQGSAVGLPGSSRFEQPRHEVVIAGLLAMSSRTVTVGEFGEFAAATNREMQGCDTYDGEWRHRPKASWRDPGFTQTAMHPVTCASWNDAVAYARWMSAKTAHRYRLPTAAEWEYAARAGGEALQPWEASGQGACASANVADLSAGRRFPGWKVFACDDGYTYTAPVASFKANAFGLNDMLGNVLQWTEDCWHVDYVGAHADGSARVDGDCTDHELRGGSWFTSPAYVRASYRNHFAADYRTSSVGFRLVRELGP